jgi:hypothetical protein
VNASILEKPGNRFTGSQCGHISLATSGGISSVCQRLSNIRRGNGAEHGTAFVADNISLIPAMTPFRQAQQSGSPKSECGRVVSMGLSNPDPLQAGQSRGPVNGATSP